LKLTKKRIMSLDTTVISVEREPSYDRILGRRSLVRAHLWRLDFVGQSHSGQVNKETRHWAFKYFEDLHVQLTTDGLINGIVDHWNAYCPVIRKYFYNTKLTQNTDDGKCTHEFKYILRDYYEQEYFTSYVKWFKAAGQKQAQFLEPEAVWKGKAPESALIYDMALRMSIFRHLPECARTLSNVVNLFFHVARLLISNDSKDKLGNLFGYEMRYLHEFMRLAGYQKGQHLDKYFTKDDLNTTCAVYAFVRAFSEDVEDRFIYAFLDRKQNVPDTNKIHILLHRVKRMTLMSADDQLYEAGEKAKAYKENPDLKTDDDRADKLLRKSFIKKWKPYWDNHGWLGGYGTFFINSAIPFAIHLFLIGLCLFLSEDHFFQLSVLINPGFITLWMIPVALGAILLLLHIIANLLGNIMFLVSIFYVHRSIFSRRTTWYIKRTAKTKSLTHCKNSGCDSRLMNMRTKHQSAFVQWLRIFLNNLFVWAISYVLTFFLLKYALIPQIRQVTYDIIDPNNDRLDHKSVEYWLLVVGLILAWAPVLLLSFTIIPISFSIISCLYSAFAETLLFARVELFSAPHSTKNRIYLSWSNIRGYLHMIFNGVYSERVFKRRLRDKRTMRFFVEKVLFKTYNPQKTCPGLYMEHFAKVWNHIVDDLDKEFLLRKEMIDKRDNKKKSEREIMSFDVHDKSQPTNWFYNTVDAICNRSGANETAQYQLSRFINYLWNPNLKPMQLVECMRALRIIIPVYNETIVETFDKITVVLNTNTSLMEHAIRKHHSEWSNFVMSFKDEKIRDKLIQLEAAVAAKTDNIGKMYLLKDTPNEKNEYEPDNELRMLVRLWVSNRFQYVCRTMKGAAKIQQSLRTLLSVQMDVMDEGLPDIDQEKKEEFIREVVSRKVRIIAGAQCYALPWSQREEDLRAHRSYVEAINYLVGLYGRDGLNFCYQKITDDGFKGFIMSGVDEHQQPIGRQVRTYGHKQNTFAAMGQGKPLHQAFLLQFFDGSIVEAVDCNQDLNASQAFLLPNVLAEFDQIAVKLVGFKEYITTINWSSAGLGAGYAEKVFGSIIQRSWTMLGGRLHYGHPDFIRGSSVMFETGMSNMDVVSEDIFLGMTILLAGGQIRYCDHYEIGKARDVCMDTTSAFQSKIASGSPQVCTSRQMQKMMRIAHFSPLYQLTLFHTITSQYLGAFIILVCCYLLAITRIILACIQLGSNRFWAPSPYDTAIFGLADSYFWLQIGISMSAPGFFQSILDGGVIEVVNYVVYLKFLRQTAFGAFHLLNTATFFAKSFKHVPHYIASGRTAGLEHKTIDLVMKNYFRSHFRVCFHLASMLVVVFLLTLNWKPAVFNGIMIAIWMWSPFLFNHGSLSSNVGNKTWTKLSNENWKFVHRFGAYHLFPQTAETRLQKQILKEKKRTTANRLLSKMYENGEEPSPEQIYDAKVKSKWARFCFCGCGRFILRIMAFFWDTYDMIYWLLFNYVYLVFILTGLHYINICVRLITLLVPFYALKPRDAEYEENRRKHVDSELLRMEQQLNEHTIAVNKRGSKRNITIKEETNPTAGGQKRQPM
jgi:hypothetical protein